MINIHHITRPALCALIFVLGITSAHSQVTIGSGKASAKGAILQLKQEETANGEANSSKGLMLPRVKLTDKSNLYPMLEGNTEYTSPTQKDTQNALHTGLVVYNINECFPFGMGTYVWNGTEWEGIFNLPALANSQDIIATIPSLLTIPSGWDKRPYTAAASFTFNPQGTVPTWSDLTADSNSNPPRTGLEFAAPGSDSVIALSFNADLATFSALPKKLPNQITPAKPWYTRQSTVRVNIPGNDCGAAGFKTVTLNQTNYASVVKETNSIAAVSYPLYTIRSFPSNKDIYVMGNNAWTLSTSSIDSNVNSIIQSATPTVGGQEKSDGDYTTTTVTIVGTNGAVGTKGSYATLTFSDPTNKANDLVFNVMQCLGGLNTSGANIIDQNYTQTSQAGNNPWADNVVRHAEKPNIYKEFYSANFGNAGRWMITNVAAKLYDNGGSDGPDVGDVLSFNLPYMVYPQEDFADDLTDPSYYDQHPEYGYLYNYPAAANQSPSQKPQGICPQGWHLPNRDEWIALTNEVRDNSEKYALSNTSNVAAAMTNACEQFNGGALGLSKPLSGGGFNIFLMGYAADLGDGLGMIVDDNMTVPGAPVLRTSFFWQSTFFSATEMGTYFFTGETKISALEYDRSAFFSVRCKKGN